MDYSSVDSEIIDSLDILRPRVKRFHENISEKTINEGKRLSVFRDDNNLTGHAVGTNIQKAASSTSLVLKKTSQREILEKYSVLSYTSLLRANRNPSSDLSITSRDKPLIKVTVIPKLSQTKTTKHRRRKPTRNKIQTTVSNHENSIHTKNLYLVVAGRKKEKIYEIRTTGSAKLSAEKIKHPLNHEEDSIERSSVKQIIDSLNMDKKKKKGKIRKENTKKMSINEDPERLEGHHDCRCINSMRNGRYVDDSKSRVQIFGQVGLTEDKRYVLKCDAMVNGEPIMTKIMSEKLTPPEYTANDAVEPNKYRTDYDTIACFGGYCQNDNYRSLRDSNIQVDFTSLGSNQNSSLRTFKSVENQGTQVNFNVCPTNKTISSLKRNQTVQCNHASLPTNIYMTENEYEHNVVKDAQSPLVIISVYPKQEFNEAKAMKSIATTNTSPISPKNTTNVKQNIKLGRIDRNYKVFDKSDDRSPKPSRSPSPSRKNVEIQQRRKYIYQTDNKLLRTKTDSPHRSPTSSNRGRTIQNNERLKANTNVKPMHDMDLFTNKNMDKINHILMSRGKKTNTEIKKALVDDYTKRITDTIDKYASKPPNLETSKVKINIDSENEYYDVQFEQGQRTTGLQIRKTVKEAASQKHEYNEHPASPENVYMLPEKALGGKHFSPSKTVRKTNESKDIGIRNSKINVRDSLEISHKREVRSSKKVVQTNKSTKQNACCKDTDFFAPIKHFKGDSCVLPDPVERDKQIRHLLGIDKEKIASGGGKQIDVYDGVVADQCLFDCFDKRDREKNLKTKLNPHALCSCKPIQTNINNKQKIKTNTSEGGSAVERTSLYQQLILNRNIQIFLQLEQFTKQKPIILSRKQYDKVKRTIQRTISKKISQEKRKKTCKCSLISVGEVRKRTKHEPQISLEFDKQTQTEKLNHYSKFNTNLNDEDDEYKISNEKKLFEHASKSYEPDKSQIKTIVLFDSKEARNTKKDLANEIVSPRQNSSSLEIHYATVGYTRRVTFSSTNVGSLSSSSILRRNDSLFTIFKGRKRSVTPNLGTSDFSLPPIELNSRSAKGFINPILSDLKPKKPFLRRLMSCLVMRSRTSEVKLPAQPNVPTTVNSSIDSYHFSSSLGAIQMGSSLYDTTASFYTNHSVLPIVNSKMKRGFFNSVREFLTSRKN